MSNRAPLKKLRSQLTEIPKSDWPESSVRSPDRVLASKEFLVQIFLEEPGVIRLSVNRTKTTAGGHWKDGITWDELQQIKRECGFGDQLALEVYPEDDQIINDANMRHLFIPGERPAFAWSYRR